MTLQLFDSFEFAGELSSPSSEKGPFEMTRRLLAWWPTAVGLACLWITCGVAAQSRGEIGYNESIRPILVENCFACHGADSASREAGLRLDLREDAIDYGAIIPGDSDSTMLLDRIYSDDPELVMPPPETKKVLTAEQKQLLVDWVDQGAEYEPHWSFIPPERPEPPTVQDRSWVRNPIDQFVLARLEAAGLSPAEEADRRTLARRVSLDLTGLPPSAEAVEAFVADPSPDAYETFVDQQIASLEWGEHRGRHWLDYARYADTHGIHFDNEREMWTYRQWVIDAFNRNLPFDEFTILQLAGDLIEHGPEASPANILEDKIASGFNRCNVTTNEGGTIPEEYYVLYARDRTETTSAVWMGLTTGCAVCHDHKFDPLSKKEFYELSAFFNNTTQNAMDGNVKDTPPILPVPLADDLPRFLALKQELPAASAAVVTRKDEAKPTFEAWLKEATLDSVLAGLPQDIPQFDLPLTEGEDQPALTRIAGTQQDLTLAPTVSWQDGPLGKATLLDGQAAAFPSVGDFEFDQAFTISCWLKPPANDTAYAVLARMDTPDAMYRGWDLWIQQRRVAMHLIHAWPDDALKAVAADQLPADRWTLVTLRYDGSGTAGGIQVFYDGSRQKMNVETNTFKKNTTRSDVPLTIGSRTGGGEAHALGLTGLSIWDRELSDAEIDGLARKDRLEKIVTLPPEERLAAAADLYEWWLGSFDKVYQAAVTTQTALEQEQRVILDRGTVAHVMNEKEGVPMAYDLDRGEYDKRLDPVEAATPAMLPPLPEDLPKNRLGLATWLMLPEHPLTARVTVNRFWQEVFGTGLVATPGDFGITGELPSHPDLLDWLAVEFRESGWDIKHLFRLMVTSATYRQAATTTPEKLTADAANRLLSRGPRFRMDAEMVRDSALAASGLLVRKLGGPSVKPYQPPGVWEAVSMGGNTNRYEPGSGDDLYRRSMYWFWKRSAPPASMEIFNAPSREVCTVRRERTNTPLQALVTLNDEQFVEAARVLAEDILTKSDSAEGSDDRRLRLLSERLLSRPFDEAETAIALGSLKELRAWYADRPDEARQLIEVGSSAPREIDPTELAAWAMLANELMNLDEFLCK